MTEVIKGSKGWTLKITGIKYCAEALAFVPWVALKNLAAEKTKPSGLRQQELKQKPLIWAREQEILRTINHSEEQIKTGICLSVRA